jgi:hypothetical protein
MNKNEILISITGKFSYQTFPLLEQTIIINEEDLKAVDNKTKCFDLENNCVIDYDNTEDLKRQKLEELRAKREPLLIAFDKYKSNVNYGIEIEDDTQRKEIVNWYNAIKDLNENALENVPERVKYYL